ncbi:hypothetical protein JTB14_032572 [Gonioctena quinquepunctata]|nr:hypothetical protein JTB14_032572 [Gonioctena quinquepunctata]
MGILLTGEPNVEELVKPDDQGISQDARNMETSHEIGSSAEIVEIEDNKITKQPEHTVKEDEPVEKVKMKSFQFFRKISRKRKRNADEWKRKKSISREKGGSYMSQMEKLMPRKKLSWILCATRRIAN